ncbi:MAG: glycerate kinase, partial [Armatimonadota bacterium]|nr:glycerate kinase [Armatimonadota bacterium]
AILSAAVDAVDPGAAVRAAVRIRRGRLSIGDRVYDLRRIRRVYVVGGGKADAPMAAALEEILGDRITAGLISVKYGHALPLRRVEVVEAGHPLPDEAGLRAAERILELVRGAARDDLVICLISGGGSALLPLPEAGLDLAQKVRLTDLLLRSGATIEEINAVRKHLSRIKGGRLAEVAAPAQVAVLILSDVLGNPPDAIASGPAAPDPTTYAQALEVLRKYGLEEKVPPEALEVLRRGARGERPETPKPGHPVFRRVHTVIVGSNEHAARAAAAAARRRGYRPLLLTTFLEGEAREAARVFAAVARSVQEQGVPLRPPACLLAGGETTVTVRGPGRGGRCQEFALAAAHAIRGRPRLLIGAFGTDGTDGPTDAAGAMADGTTVERARRVGLDPAAALAANDAYPFFSALGDLIVTGPTRTNVNDLYVALVDGPAGRRRRRRIR